MSEFSKVLRDYGRYCNAFGGYDHEEKLYCEAADIIDRQDITVDFLVNVIARLTGLEPVRAYELILSALQQTNEPTQERK